LLKNNDATLPLSPKMRVLIAGDGAHDIGKQSGGWTLSWQGTGNKNSDFPNGQSIFDGVREHVEAAGGDAVLSESGDYSARPDVAIVVFGEDPYAEFQGDIEHVEFVDNQGLELLRKFKTDGIKTVAVFLSGRPMWMNSEINVADAFVAAWLPGGQGGGVADVLFSKANGSVGYDFTGKLSFSWPRYATQTAVNVGDADYDPLFAYGYGLSYADAKNLDELPEDTGLDGGVVDAGGEFIRGGDAAGIWRMAVRDSEGSTQITDSAAVSASGSFKATSVDLNAQEDTRILEWSGFAVFGIEGNPRDFSRESNGDMAIHIRYSVLSNDIGVTTLETWCRNDGACAGAIDITDNLREHAGKGWRDANIKLSCFEAAGADMSNIVSPVVIRSSGPLRMQIESASLVANIGSASCEF